MPKDECNELKTIQYKTMLLNHKEIKEDIKCDSSTNIEDFLNKESKMHKVEPWNKLDKTTKVKKLEKYADKLKEDNKLTKEELAHLSKYLTGCLDKKRLQKTSDVTYNKEDGFIENIGGLVFDKKRRKFTLKKAEKRVSTLRALPPKKGKQPRPKSAKGAGASSKAKTKKKKTPKSSGGSDDDKSVN
tara:strand:- start:104 stop:664 length:561 start_codon:yes stop_codon:yes gene_type:complete